MMSEEEAVRTFQQDIQKAISRAYENGLSVDFIKAVFAAFEVMRNEQQGPLQ